MITSVAATLIGYILIGVYATWFAAKVSSTTIILYYDNKARNSIEKRVGKYQSCMFLGTGLCER